MLDFLRKYQIEDDVLAVGVSGGADSLALILWVNETLKSVGKKVVALTVDHQLRPESKDEAEYVHQLMLKEGIEHHILVWDGIKPKTGIEEAARINRYRLLSDWCLQHQVRCLCVAHHALDQAETFIIRLQRGSGLYGLCGMQEVSEMYGLKILRPFLTTHPEDLKEYLRRKSIEWVTDSSNDCDDFLRVRIRKFLPQLENSVGVSSQRLVETMAVLKRSRDYIISQVERFIRQNVRYWDNVGVSLSLAMFKQQHEEIVYHVLATLIKRVGQSDYTARADDIDRLVSLILPEKYNGIDCQSIKLDILQKDVANLSVSKFKGATLGHCELFVAQNKLWIVPELKIKNKLPKKVWDEFCAQYPSYKKQNLPYKLRVALVKTKMDVEF